MTVIELLETLEQIQKMKAETQTLELKAAQNGCPTKLYDTLSSFSNQDEGGILIFGVDEKSGFAEVGVYDVQDLVKHVGEQCLQMSPAVRPTFTVAEKQGRYFVAAEVPGMDITSRPCYYAGRGRLKGAYIRVGDADEPMTEYEIYSYEAFRKKYQDDIRPVERGERAALDSTLMQNYLLRLKLDRPNLAKLEDGQILELMSMVKEGKPTLAAMLLFGLYPQAYYPQLSILATRVPGTELGQLGSGGERFLDARRIEGTLTQMLEDALAFVRANTQTRTIVEEQTGKRIDRTEYPMVAVREAILNALIHRDYSIHTEGMPIQLLLFDDRFELRNPGGLYGRIRVDQLGKLQPDTRNPVIAVAMEVLQKAENRYSGIPTMRREMREAGMEEPEFCDERGTFVVRFKRRAEALPAAPHRTREKERDIQARLLEFCNLPRTRSEIAAFLGIKTSAYAMRAYVTPLLEQGLLQMTVPESPGSRKQRYVAVERRQKT